MPRKLQIKFIRFVIFGAFGLNLQFRINRNTPNTIDILLAFSLILLYNINMWINLIPHKSTNLITNLQISV